MNQFFRVAIVVLALVGIFLAGGITGGVVTAQFISRHRQERDIERMQAFDRVRQAERQQFAQANNALRKQLQATQLRLQQILRSGPQRKEQGPPQWKRLVAPEQYGPTLMQRFANQLRLTDEQREKIRPLVFEAGEKLRRLRRDTAHQTEVIVEELEDQISAVLTSVQLDKFNGMIQQWRDRFDWYNRRQQELQAEERLRQQQQQQRRVQPPKPTPSRTPPKPAGPSGAATAVPQGT